MKDESAFFEFFNRNELGNCWSITLNISGIMNNINTENNSNMVLMELNVLIFE